MRTPILSVAVALLLVAVGCAVPGTHVRNATEQAIYMELLRPGTFEWLDAYTLPPGGGTVLPRTLEQVVLQLRTQRANGEISTTRYLINATKRYRIEFNPQSGAYELREQGPR